MKTSSVLAATAALLAGSAVASPLKRSGDLVAADIIAQIAPSSTSCANTDECRTNKQVGPLLVEAMSAYQIYQPAAMASIIALEALESGEFKYKRNLQHASSDSTHWGQGTVNMQMFEYNLKFANSFTELKDKVTAIGSTTTEEAKNKVLDLVADDQYNFKSGSWFFATQCGADVHSAFEGTDIDAAWEAHMACVLGSKDAITADRTAYWTKAKAAFGLS